jgi:hypothetical protein
MKRLIGIAALALLLATVLLAAEDLTGKWSGSFNMTLDGQTREDAVYMVLKQCGAELTGTAGPNVNQQWPILKGKIEGDKVTFEVQTDEPLIKFDLTLAEGHLKGNAKAEHQGRSMQAVVDAQRQKE